MISELRNRFNVYYNEPTKLATYEFPRDINRFAHRTVSRWNFSEKGIDILSEDWDNLIILDACRYDVFEEIDIPGELIKKHSKASATVEWLQNNFSGSTVPDAVYVTANGQISNHPELNIEFHFTKVLHERWDDDLGNVPPEATTAEAKKYAEEFPNKRLIVHFNQPHYPFIGSDYTFGNHPNSEDRTNTFWEDYREQDFEDQRVWEAYKKTLEITVPHVRDLLKDLSGKTVISADHGNMFGERAFPIPIREYGHPIGLYTPELIEVPWLVHTEGERKTIVSEPPIEDEIEHSSRVVKQRLEQLGYREVS